MPTRQPTPCRGHSELVVAIWDPSRENKLGGTGVTVAYAIERRRLVQWLNPSDLGAGPFILRAARGDGPGGWVKEAIPDRARLLSLNFHRLAAYNRDGAGDEVVLARQIEDGAASHREAGGSVRTGRGCDWCAGRNAAAARGSSKSPPA